jgi:hypothetical protein
MNETTNIVPLRQPDEIDDPLTNILRAGALAALRPNSTPVPKLLNVLSYR